MDLKPIQFRLLTVMALTLGALLAVGFVWPERGASAGWPDPLEAQPSSIPRPAVSATAVVTVTNTSDTVDGDTANIAALLGSPGPDGTISFREALNAANGTLGPKRIGFAPALAGGRIVFAPDGDFLTLASGDLTIDGDIDADGQPDITLDGSASETGRATVGLVIDSSHNTITGLALADFKSSAIWLTCLHAGCTPKLFSDNRIIGNVVSTSRGTLPLIYLTPIGVLPLEELPAASDVLWQNIVIAGNTITNTSPALWAAVGINAAIGGASRNRISGLTITDNRITGGWVGINASGQSSDSFGVPGPPRYSDDNIVEHVQITDNVIRPETTDTGSALYLNAAGGGGTRNVLRDVTVARNRLLPDAISGIDVIVADANSGFFGAPGPIKYTDGNRIEDLRIEENTIEAPGGIALNIGAANFGNRDNELRRVQVIGNEIADCSGAGVNFVAGNGGFGGANYGDRSTRDNRIAEVEIRDNTISDTWIGITLWAGLGGQNPLTPADANHVTDVTVAGNRITDFNNAGIGVMAGSAADIGSSAGANGVQRIAITGNRIEQIKRPHHATGVQILGAHGGAIPARANAVGGIVLNDNEIIRAGIGIQVLGGEGPGARDNTARVACPAGNRLTHVPTPWDVRDDSDGATGNLARVTWCSYLPLLLR